MLASGNKDSTLKLWDRDGGRLPRTLSGNEGVVTSVAWSPDGKTLASGNGDSTAKLRDSGTGQLLHTLSGHEGIVTSVAWSPDGKTLASGSADRTVKLWDSRSGLGLRTLRGHLMPSRRSRGVWTAKRWPAAVWTIRVGIWDIGGGPPRKLSGHTKAVNSVAWSPDGKTLASGSEDGTLKLWDRGSGHLLRTLEAVPILFTR